MSVKRPRNILSGPGRPLADRFPEGWRRALGYSWAGPFEAGTPENLDGISELERRGSRCLLPMRPGQGASDRGAKQDGPRQPSWTRDAGGAKGHSDARAPNQAV